MRAVDTVLWIIESSPTAPRGLTFARLVMSLELDAGFVASDLLALGDGDLDTAIELIREWRMAGGGVGKSMALVAATYAVEFAP